MCNKKYPLEIDIMHKLRQIDVLARRKAPPPTPKPENLPPQEGKESFCGFGAGRLLGILMESESGLVQTQLADMLNIRPQSLSELIMRLEGNEFIKRHPSQEDRRQTVVSITEKGREHHTKIRARHLQNAQMFLSPLDEEEKYELARLLDKILQSDSNIKRSDTI